MRDADKNYLEVVHCLPVASCSVRPISAGDWARVLALRPERSEIAVIEGLLDRPKNQTHALYRDLGRPVLDVRALRACSEMLAEEVEAARSFSLSRNLHRNQRYPPSNFYALQLLHEYHLGKWQDDENFSREGGNALSMLLSDGSPAFAFVNVIKALDLDAR